MEIILKEVQRITYVQNLFDFNPYLYFNTYTAKIRHLKENPLSVVGLYRIKHGSDLIEEVFEDNIENYSVLYDKVYYYFENQVKYFVLNRKEIHVDNNFISVNFDFNTKQTILRLPDASREYSNKALVYFDHTNFEHVSETGRMNRYASLTNKMMDCNNLTCYSFIGQLLWEVKVSDLLGLSIEHFQWPKNGFQKVFCIDNYWIIQYRDNTILRLDVDGTVSWSRFQWTYHTYHQADGRLYAFSEEHLSIIDPKTGEILLSNDIKIIKEKYNCKINRGGIWVYEDYVFLPAHKRNIEWIVFNKLTLEEVGKMYLFHPDEDYFVTIPVDYGASFYFIKNKVYILDGSQGLRIFNVEFKK